MIIHLTRRPARVTWAALLALVLLGGVGSLAENASSPGAEECASGQTTEDGTCTATAEGDDPSCVDNHEDCQKWFGLGECVANPTYMLFECRKSCGVCGYEESEADVQPCEDDIEGCTDKCELDLLRCRKTCGTCVNSSTDFGVEQEVEGNEDEAQTRVIIRESIKYMREIKQNRENKKIAMCKNTDKLCSFWAGIGECKKNPGFMNTECGPACQSCYLIDIKARCPMPEDAEAALEPGDLNNWFEEITAEGSEFEQYHPTVLSRPLKEGETDPVGYREGPWIVTFDDFVSDEEVDRLLYHGNETGYKRSSDVGKVKHDGTHDSLVSKSRTSENAWCGDACKEDPVVATLIERIAKVTNTPPPNSEDLQLLRYEPGQYYVQHHDYIEHQLERPCGVRIYTLFLYLNEVEEGGETSFPEVDLMVTPKKGKAVLWPSVLDEDPNAKDPRTDHEAMPVKKGVKFGANAWIHMGDFQAALLNNCHN